MFARWKFYLCLLGVCLLYWLIDSTWSFFSFEQNIRVMIFSEPTSLWDPLLLRVSPYQMVSRIIVVALFLISGAFMFEILKKKHHAETAYSQSEEKFERLINNASDVIVIVQDGMIKYFNPIAASLLGYSKEALYRIPIDQLIHPEDREAVMRRYQKRIEGDQPRTTNTIRIQTADDDVRWVQFNSTLITWDSRPATLNIGRDLTLEHQQAERIQQTHKLEAIGTLAGGVAHDFNNILGIIIGNAELALDDVPQWNPGFKNVKAIKDAGLRARDIVKQLLNFSRKAEQQFRAVHLQPIIRESITLLRATLPAHIGIHHHFEDIPLTIRADPSQLHQIMINLGTNAAHAMEAGDGWIDIRLERRPAVSEDQPTSRDNNGDGFAQLSVSDKGTGIAPEILSKIFDPYFTTKDIDQGTGLGLAVVHGIVKNHDATITVESRVGEGTCVNILFPLVPEVPAAEIASTGELPRGQGRILVVDDEPSIAITARTLLERLGYTVISFTDPQVAMDYLQSDPHRIDLVITDMTMPGLSGDQVVRQVQKMRPDLPVFLCTGYSEKIDAEKAVALGVRRYLEKPLDRHQLAVAVHEVLRNIKE